MFASVSFTFGIAFVSGVFLAIVILTMTRRDKTDAGVPVQRPSTPGWWTLALGLIAATAFALTVWWPISSNAVGRGLNLISIAFGFAAVLVGIGNLIRRDRHWPTWVGLLAGLIPAVFWIAFAAANLLTSGA